MFDRSNCDCKSKFSWIETKLLNQRGLQIYISIRISEFVASNLFL